MGGGGKTSSTSQQVQIPPEVLARYNSVNAQAQTAAAAPFQTYSNNPNAFVAPLTDTQQSGIAGVNAAAGQAQPYYGAATDALMGAQGAATPFYSAATDALLGGINSANPLQSAAGSNYVGAFAGAQPFNAGAATSFLGGLAGAQPLQTSAAQNITGAQTVGNGLAGASLGSLAGANAASNPIQYSALGGITDALQGAQPFNAGATGAFTGGFGAAQPLNQAAGQGFTSALQGAQPFQLGATGLTLAGAGAVNPSDLDSASIMKYLNPYLGSVLGNTSALINQNNQQQQSGQLGNAINQHAFGGDRAGLAAAALAGQQELAAGNIYSGILNTGFNTALSTAQQQQQLGLGAAQANRQALTGAGAQLAGIGQQGFAQGTTTAQQQAALAQQLFGQFSGLGQNLLNVGNQQFTQGLGAAGAASGIGGQLFSQGAQTAAQQAALGQQQFGQGLGAAQAQAGLGQQVFGQGQTLGSNLAGLGQQMFGQGTALGSAQQGLGQQEFAQGLGASQQAAALGQGIFGMGQGTAQTLAGLGTGAQGAALQGSQAQLAAGQTQQQTQQAGLSALYNQFLQQQSYPFQVSQFLANIAEGTGALSGSTTTTTQPGGFFSDERLKEDIEPVGKTFDGQNIVKFRYKGEPRTQIGLLAQNVEKKHPGAVGLAAGYKTVDYDEATRGAAARGKFYKGGLVPANDNVEDRRGYAYGGYPELPGVPASDISALLAAQQQMYAPFANTGLYGGVAGGAPRGGSSYVPAATLPVGHLAVAGDLPRQESPLDQMTQITNLAGELGKGASSVGSWLHRKSPAGGLTVSDDPDNVLPFRRGGLVPGYALGGEVTDDDPYKPKFGPSLDIPNQPSNAKLALPGAPPKSDSGLGGIGGLLSGVASIAKFIPGLAKGGAVDAPLIPEDPANADMQDSVLRLVRKLTDHGDDEDQPEAPNAFVAPHGGGLGGGVPVPVAPPNTGPSSGLGAASPAAGAAPKVQPSSLPADLARILPLIAAEEGTGKNPRSSARGPYQIVDRTFVGLFHQLFPDRAENMTPAQILAVRATPEGAKISGEMGPVIAKQNMQALKDAGFEPSAGNIYLAHFLGAGGAKRVLGADPATPVSDLLDHKALRANPSILPGRTAGQVVQWASGEMQRQADRLARAQRSKFARGGFADGGDPTDPTYDPLPSDPGGGPTPNVSLTGSSGSGPIGPSAPPDRSGAPAEKPEHHGFLHDLSRPENFIPILAGIAAMGTAPTVHPGVALAAGLGAGANAYQAQRQFGLEQQATAQKGEQVRAYATAMGVEPEVAAAKTTEAKAAMLNAKMAAVSQARQLFASNYQQVGDPNAPWLEMTTGRHLTQAEYSAAWEDYLSKTLGGIQGGPAIPMLSGSPPAPGGASDGLPNGDGLRVPVPGGAGPGGVGGAAVSGMPGPAVLHGGAAVPSVSGPGSVGAPVGDHAAPAAPLGHVAPTGTLSEKLKAGAYMAPPIQVPRVDNSQISEQWNPDVLTRDGNALVRNATTPELRAVGMQKLEMAQKILNGDFIPTDRSGQPFTAYANARNAIGTNEQITKAYGAQIAQHNQAAEEFAQQYPQSMQILNSLARVYRSNDLERQSHLWSDVIGAIRSVPWMKDALSPQFKQYQDAHDEAAKDAARQAIVAGVAAHMISNAPASVLRQTNMTVPNPSLGAGARYNLLGQMAAIQSLSRDYYKDWSANKGRVMDVGSYDGDWSREHNITDYERHVFDRLQPFPGMTAQEMAQHPRRPKSWDEVKKYRKGVPFITPDGTGRIAYGQGD